MKYVKKQTRTLERFGYIDALRGVAILAVLISHLRFFGTNTYPAWTQAIVNHGTLGVQLFYIISAFTLCMAHDTRRSQEKRPVVNFFIRRFFRIAPLFYVAIVFYLFFYTPQDRSILGMPTQIHPATILATITFLHGLVPAWINTIVPGGWSIAVEAGFYLLFPVLFRLIRSTSTALKACFVSALGFQIVYYILSKLTPLGDTVMGNDFLYYFFPSQLPVFLVGFWLFWLAKKRPDKSQLTRTDTVWVQLGVGLILLQLVTQSVLPYRFLFSLLFGLGIYLLGLVPINLVVNRFTIFVGKISYSLYIGHFAVLTWLGHHGLVDFVQNGILNLAIRFGLVCILSTALAVVTYYLVEVPGMELGKRIIVRLERVNTPTR